MDIVSYSSVYETKCLVGRVRVQNYELGPPWTTVFKKMAPKPDLTQNILHPSSFLECVNAAGNSVLSIVR
ncbi:hypothetical protein DPMN_155340 [Dreissena polymorpha]|uniref:Uncharacterized protein n=1 Tax=Dreissena polymorpha TaxID=45954 RepID=A0A9D4J6J5_DREPO|nr:hypothetical protein DPMN_155340 [Dreissena polymorpha]